MYGWIWRKLPGSPVAKICQAVVLAIIAVAVLFLWVFPWLATVMPIDRVTV